MESNTFKKLEEILKELKDYEKKGLDTSSLKIFVKNFKEFLKLNNQSTQSTLFTEELTFEKKLEIIKSMLEDKRAFPTVNKVIEFANSNLSLDFKDQKESREVTISRIIGRIRSKPELKDNVKKAVLNIRNEMVHKSNTSKSKREIITAETFSKWADIIKNI